MKKNKIIGLIVILILLISACFLLFIKTDVIRTGAEKSLKALISNNQKIIKENKSNYTLTMDNETKLTINKDFNTKEDIKMTFLSEPFLKAGLELNNLPKGFKVTGDNLVIETNFGTGVNKSFTDGFFRAVDNNRDALAYHEDLDHYGITLTGGNKFEFAKDYLENDLDIVFVLLSKPLEAKGVNTKKIDGWVFKALPQKDGSKLEVIVKPYSLKDIK